MEDQKKIRTALRSIFTRKLRELNVLLAEEEPNREEVIVLSEIIKEKFDTMEEIDKKILNLLIEEDISEEALILEFDTCDDYATKFHKAHRQCKKIINTVEERAPRSERAESICSENIETNINSVQTKRKFKLPVIDWLSFWSQFKKIHEEEEIDPADKIFYLIQATVPNSRARRLVESYPAVSSNYEKIIEALKARFGREDLQIEVYIRDFLKLVVTTHGKKEVNIAMLYDNIETYMRALETMGVKSDKYGAILFPMVESCLPEDLLRLWQRTQRMQADDEKSEDTHVRLDCLLRFLRNEADNEQRIILAREGIGLKEKSFLKETNR